MGGFWVPLVTQVTQLLPTRGTHWTPVPWSAFASHFRNLSGLRGPKPLPGSRWRGFESPPESGRAQDVRPPGPGSPHGVRARPESPRSPVGGPRPGVPGPRCCGDTAGTRPHGCLCVPTGVWAAPPAGVCPRGGHAPGLRLLLGPGRTLSGPSASPRGAAIAWPAAQGSTAGVLSEAAFNLWIVLQGKGTFKTEFSAHLRFSSGYTSTCSCQSLVGVSTLERSPGAVAAHRVVRARFSCCDLQRASSLGDQAVRGPLPALRQPPGLPAESGSVLCRKVACLRSGQAVSPSPSSPPSLPPVCDAARTPAPTPAPGRGSDELVAVSFSGREPPGSLLTWARHQRGLALAPSQGGHGVS